MRLLSNGTQQIALRDMFRGVRELRALITYEGPDGYYLLTDETDNNLITEQDLNYLGTERERINIKEDSIISVKFNCKASYTKTICKMIDLNVKFDIPLGKEITLKVGCKWDYDGDYYYADIGRFYVKHSEYDPDTNSYKLTCYDKMYESMIKYDGDLNLTFPCTHREFLEAIFNKFGWNYTSQSYTNAEFDSVSCLSDNATIEKDIYEGQDMTYRDVIDDLAITFGALYFDERDILTVRRITSGTEDINYEDLKQKTVNITEPYEWDSSLLINKVTLTNSEGMTYLICENIYAGSKEYDIGNNIFVQYMMNKSSSSDYNNVQSDLSNFLILEQIYQPAELDTVGIMTVEPLDAVRIYDTDGNIIKTVKVMEDSFNLCRGLEETITVEEQEEVKKEYVTSSPTTSDIKNAIINIDKANGQIVLKVNSNDELAEVALNADPDTGGTVQIKADSINFDSHTFDLTTDSINISSTNFSVDNTGNITANSGTIGNWNIEANSGNTYGALYSDSGNYRVYLQPYQNIPGHYEHTWVISVQNSGNGLFIVEGNGDLTCQKLVANNIKCGTCYLTSSDTPVSFGYTFTGTPKVVITPRTSASGVIAPKVRSVSTTGFVATIGGSISGTIECDWIAIYD